MNALLTALCYYRRRQKRNEETALLASLPADVRCNVIAFLVNKPEDTRLWICDCRQVCICHRKIQYLNVWGARSVIATGVASQQHSIWRRDGYQWWNVLGRQCVARVTRNINRRLLEQFFNIWWIITGVPRVRDFDQLLLRRDRHHRDWFIKRRSWWKVLERIHLTLGGIVFGPSSSWEVAFRRNDNDFVNWDTVSLPSFSSGSSPASSTSEQEDEP